MAEPQTTGSALAAGAAKGALSGGGIATTLPLDPVTMGVGLVAALITLLHIKPGENEPRTPLRVFALVVASGFMAGIFMPIAVAGGTHYLPWLTAAGDRPLQLAAAALLGVLPHLAPVLWRLYREQKGGAP
jgi:hypothetical protein